MTESEEKNSVLKFLQGKREVAMAELVFGDPVLISYNKYGSDLVTDGYVQVINLPNSSTSFNATALKLTDAGNDFISKGGYTDN